MKALLGMTLMAVLLGCQPDIRAYDVLINREEVCRTFAPAPESCALTNTPDIRMRITIEDRGDGRAIIYGRSDTTENRTYLAEIPREGRYEVRESSVSRDSETECSATVQTIVALNVTDRGLEGGEEYRAEEEPKCNQEQQRRITRRLREWAGTRVAEEQ